MTLLEMTIVILVLITLISILFVGARAWKKGSDRASNLINIRNIQQAVRSHENLNGLTAGSSELNPDAIFTRGTRQGYLNEPSPPSQSGVLKYAYLNIVPTTGTLYVSNVDEIGPSYAPDKKDYADW